MRSWRALAVGLLAGITLGSHVAPVVAQEQRRPDVTIDVIGRLAAPRDYQYPYRDPYLATMTIAALNATGVTPGLPRQTLHVPVLPGRNNIPSLEGRGDVSISLYRQNRPAPLMFLLCGIGSNPYFGLGTYFASLFHHEGFHVVILPSPMTWNFALAASRSGAPGYAPADARDLYEVMLKTLAMLESRYRLQITGTYFMGASLGALEGAYLSVIDADQGKIGISRFLLINPPLDVSRAIKTLDEWAALQNTFGTERAKALQGKALSIIEASSTGQDDDTIGVERAARQFSSFSPEELQFLIGKYAETMLPELVYVTQILRGQSKPAGNRELVDVRLEEAKSFTLTDYSEKIALPSWTSATADLEADLETVSRRSSLMSIVDRLRTNPRVEIMHNADDILTDPASIAELKQIMGAQMIVYPLGGHLGNLWYRDNKEDILRFFGRSLQSSTPSSSN